MPTDKKRPNAWKKSDKSIRAVQVIFELEQSHSRNLRINAIKLDLSPSDYIRDIIGLPRKKPIRPRLSISLSADDYVLLAERYDLQPDEQTAIREKIKEELLLASKNEDQ
ncbi:hypothetical protein [sulfur-oxidizing endosymbiont of Gigantopelta aegis]|uniref:hypothetical protein n=1 Tax=sulfur-oxidizing endosymbiont of Gigantopelta aegis TaxID=2794934 RepID=UPI0018DE50BC|nr:hypothetical protein [sulfur-oxidizing endosymbiont of Gigantopelta aegis]